MIHSCLISSFMGFLPTRSVSDEHPVLEQSRIISQDGEEVANQSTACLVDTAVHSCSVCGKRFSNAVSLRCVLKLK
jgi:hypothetical protein